MVVLLIIITALAGTTLVGTVVCCQKRRWGYALGGLIGVTVSGHLAVAAIVAGIDRHSGDVARATSALCVVLSTSIAITWVGARNPARPGSLWARHHWVDTTGSGGDRMQVAG